MNWGPVGLFFDLIATIKNRPSDFGFIVEKILYTSSIASIYGIQQRADLSQFGRNLTF